MGFRILCNCFALGCLAFHKRGRSAAEAVAAVERAVALAGFASAVAASSVLAVRANLLHAFLHQFQEIGIRIQEDRRMRQSQSRL